jgi:hypothetical protein
MKILLEHFFKDIAGIKDIAVECLDKNLYRCNSPALKKFSEQRRYYHDCLASFGLANVIVYNESEDSAEFIVDFDPKHAEAISSISNKFLVSQQRLWTERGLDAYASLILEDLNIKKWQGLASHLLLGFNFNTSAPSSYSYKIERSEDSTLLTFDEPKVATVLYLKPHEMRVISNGFYLNSYLRLAQEALIPLFLNQRSPSQQVEVNTKMATIVVNGAAFTLKEIENILTQSNRITALATNQRNVMTAMKNVIQASIDLER